MQHLQIGQIVYFNTESAIIETRIKYIKHDKKTGKKTFYLDGWINSFEQKELFYSLEEAKLGKNNV